jgi:AcrR family transcriptional regulator
LPRRNKIAGWYGKQVEPGMNGRAQPRRRLAPEERRMQIIEGATAYFAEKGLEGTTRDLSARLGITQSLLYAYFNTKAELVNAVYQRVYLDRISPDWPTLIRDRRLPIGDRLHRFYCEYAEAIFSYEWMRIFMFSGLAGVDLNRRYLDHLSRLILRPMLAELEDAASGPERPVMEDIWNLHGGIVYIGIRKYVYRMDAPDEYEPSIRRALNASLRQFGVTAVSEAASTN